jgi:hypothetical protein
VGIVHLKAESGIPVGMSLPLHATINEQWRNGVLKRVTADGAPWWGDEFDLTRLEGDVPPVPADGGDRQDPPSAPAAGGGRQEEGHDPEDEWSEPPRPVASAPLKAWQEYATALGACSEEEAAAMTRAALIKLCTPPEADPLAEV